VSLFVALASLALALDPPLHLLGGPLAGSEVDDPETADLLIGSQELLVCELGSGRDRIGLVRET
jgi:hypothetical protein